MRPNPLQSRPTGLLDRHELEARLFRRKVGEAATVGRIGGDEFGLIVPDAAHVDSYLIAERLRKSVREELRHGSQILT
jgi:GGDEF domain-containing protein